MSNYVSNYATKSDLKGATDIDTSKSATLKSEVHSWDIDKLESTRIESKLMQQKMMLLKIVCMMNWLKRLILLIQTKS